MKSNAINVTEESFASLTALWKSQNRLDWNSIFVLPAWMQVWWQEFGRGDKPYFLNVKQGEETTGIAPLFLQGKTASLVGSADVCDYLDFIVVPGQEKDFFNTLLDDLKKRGIEDLDLGAVRPNSTVMTSLVPLAREKGCEVSIKQEDVSVELELPDTYDKYLALLEGKQRHELNRKIRNASAEGKLNYRIVSDKAELNKTLDDFFKMFTESRHDKAEFLTTDMETYFRSLLDAMAGIGLARIGVLDLDNVPVAMILYFDYRDCIYLYNSGYDPRYESLSAGLLCKVMSIQAGIESGKKVFNFLKGNEIYKYRLGGKEVPLYRCGINIG
ncbi:MAG: GNAT family N-acetyltransferase [Dehalococcoidales bacterium]|nr:GNAT family N-acetyltransferase [Dehalococcoidales bacterium]